MACEIGDGLLDAVVEDVEVFAAKTINEIAVGIGDDDADVDAIHADANRLGRCCDRFLGSRERLERQDQKANRVERQTGLRKSRKRITAAFKLVIHVRYSSPSLKPLIEVDAFGVFPGCAGHEV